MTPRYRVTVNGWKCHNETWDDVFNWDGKHDEVFVSVGTKVVDANGTVLDNLTSESEVMGDTWRIPNRVQAGTASDRGGIISGDPFPWEHPERRRNGINDARIPPYTIWEGELPPGQVVFLSPTLWEWDPGAGAWDGWLAWQAQVDQKYGQVAKDITSKVWPLAQVVFPAISLGIQTAASLAGLWSPLGQSMRRPIGTQRDPNNPDASLFSPWTIALSQDTAEYLLTSNPQGLGEGIRGLQYVDDPYLRGVYTLYVQIERVGDAAVQGWTDVGHANGVVAMTALDDRLYCATADNGLWMRDPLHQDIDWVRIGHANNVVGLAATGGRLFCATSDNRLWTRDAVPWEVNWTDIGHANGVTAMTGLDGRLFCATNDGRLWSRPTVLSEVNWTEIGLADARAMAAAPGSLYAANDSGLYRRDPVLTQSSWSLVDQPLADLRGLVATSSDLFAATGGNRLLVRSRP